MTKAKLWVVWGAFAVLTAGCGRTTLTSNESDGPILWPDLWVPVTDGGGVENWPYDSRPPPPVDGWPPHLDHWPPPPPLDFWPPPHDFGPCVATCADKCQLLFGCGLYSGGWGKCVNSDCPSWPPGQSNCLAQLLCYPPPTPDICPLVKSCLGPPPQQADLAIISFTAAVNGNTVSYSITTCNQGQTPAGDFYVDVYYDQKTAPSLKEFGDQYTHHAGGLAAGACVTDSFTRNNTQPGTYDSWAQVDADGIVAEADETNNVNGPIKVKVTGPPPPKGPDLVIQSMTTQIYGTLSITVRYQMEICNVGSDPAGQTQVHVYYDLAAPPAQGTPGNKSTSVPGLAPGACTTRNIYRYNTPSGSYSSYAQVDPNNVVAEADETNNVAGPVQVTVGTAPGADLTINAFTHQIYGTSTVRYHMQICNVGTGSTGPTEVHVYFNQVTAPKAGDQGDQSTSVPMLQPGDCTNRNIFRFNTPAGTYNSWAQVDPDNTVTETDESNNVSGPIKVTVGGTTQQADLTFTGFNAQVVMSAAGTEDIQYAMVVCNNGQTAASSFRVDIYYDRTTPPPSGLPGDDYQTVASLGAGACTTVTRTYNSPPAGTYLSWARVDTLDAVTESNENNNVAGPTTVTVGTPSNCAAICAFAIACGLLQPNQLSQCLTWCNGLTTAALQCVTAAMQNGSCSDLKNCNIPPPPPPPPPPGVCPDICNYLINTCNLLPSSQYWTCVGACENLTPDKIQCAQDAMAKGQCMQVVYCIL
jgi:subtilase family serine protease